MATIKKAKLALKKSNEMRLMAKGVSFHNNQPNAINLHFYNEAEDGMLTVNLTIEEANELKTYLNNQLK